MPLIQITASGDFSRTKRPSLIQMKSGIMVIILEEKNAKVGREWTAKELRRKSWKDIHTIWWLCMREMNYLATQEKETIRLHINSTENHMSKRRDTVSGSDAYSRSRKHSDKYGLFY